MKYDGISTVQMGLCSTQEAKNTYRMYYTGTKGSEGVEVTEVQKEIVCVCTGPSVKLYFAYKQEPYVFVKQPLKTRARNQLSLLT